MPTPRFTEMNAQQCEALLQRTHVGRLAFSLHDAVDVVPLGFRYDKGWIYGRTSPAGKLETLDRNRRVAFEIDEFSGPFEWESIVIHGTFYLLDHGSDEAVQTKLRAIFPEAFEGNDPVAFRNQFFGISIDEMTGRSAVPSSGEKESVVVPQVPTASAPDPLEDVRLRDAVVAAVAKIAGDDGKSVRVSAVDGVVTLTGAVSAPPVRTSLDSAITAIPGVRAIVQELDVEWPLKVKRAPAEVAAEAVKMVERSLGPGKGRVVVIFENGWIRLEGRIKASDHQAVLSSLQLMPGARGVVDRLGIMK